MGVNSIRSNLDKNSIISSLRLALSADIKTQTAFIIVEGEDDSKLLKKFVMGNVTIYESFSGKEGIKEIITCEYINDKRVVGIRDKDYHEGSVHERIFFYDKSCMEMMIMQFDSVFASIYHEFYTGNQSIENLNLKIFSSLFFLSMFRKYNEQRDLRIKFKDFSFLKILDENLGITINMMISELQARSANCTTCLQALYNEITGLILPDLINKYLHIINGHDFIQMFQVHCNSASNRKHISHKHIAAALRVAFGHELFITTEIYSKTTNYSRSVDIVLWTV